MESLASMQSFLRGRPSTFNSLEHAIEWRYICIILFALSLYMYVEEAYIMLSIALLYRYMHFIGLIIELTRKKSNHVDF